MIKVKMLIILLFLIIINTKVEAHPHIFIDYKATVIFDNNGLKKIKMNWNMDDITSSNFFDEFDLNKDKILDSKELNNIKNTTLNNLKKDNYFINIKVNDKENLPIRINDFKVFYESNLIKYSFLLDCNIKGTKKENKIEIKINDKSNYVAFNPIDKKVIYESSPKITLKNIENNSDYEQIILFKFSEKK
ncbi:MAG: DUF1007 family protein [Candidatus Sericytochromatia bacterium]